MTCGLTFRLARTRLVDDRSSASGTSLRIRSLADYTINTLGRSFRKRQLWWRTAEGNSQALAATINEQIVSAVGKELETITTEARAAHTAIRTLFVQNVLETREADKREF